MSRSLVNRRQVRETATQTIFLVTDPKQDVSIDEAVQYALESGSYPDEGYNQVENHYLMELINGVIERKNELDGKIEDYLKDGWTIERIARIDATILRIAFYEMMYVDEEQVPDTVAVNEAIEMSKLFSDDQSRQFINGVLANALNDFKKEND